MNNINDIEKIEKEKLTFMEDFKRRLRLTKTTRWIRFAVVSLLLCGFDVVFN